MGAFPAGRHPACPAGRPDPAGIRTGSRKQPLPRGLARGCFRRAPAYAGRLSAPATRQGVESGAVRHRRAAASVQSGNRLVDGHRTKNQDSDRPARGHTDRASPPGTHASSDDRPAAGTIDDAMAGGSASFRRAGVGGADDMTVTELLAELTRQGVQVSAEGDELTVRAPKGVLTPGL